MTYDVALTTAQRIGAAKAEGLPLLAMTLKALALAHAINPKLAYDGAVKKGMTAAQIRRLDPLALGDLMFVLAWAASV